MTGKVFRGTLIMLFMHLLHLFICLLAFVCYKYTIPRSKERCFSEAFTDLLSCTQYVTSRLTAICAC